MHSGDVLSGGKLERVDRRAELQVEGLSEGESHSPSLQDENDLGMDGADGAARCLCACREMQLK